MYISLLFFSLFEAFLYLEHISLNICAFTLVRMCVCVWSRFVLSCLVHVLCPEGLRCKMRRGEKDPSSNKHESSFNCAALRWTEVSRRWMRSETRRINKVFTVLEKTGVCAADNAAGRDWAAQKCAGQQRRQTFASYAEVTVTQTPIKHHTVHCHLLIQWIWDSHRRNTLLRIHCGLKHTHTHAHTLVPHAS